jgi:hypothetical protein
MLVALQLDLAEHDRRRSEGIGAVTSVGLLHGLWLLPAGFAVQQRSLPDHKLDLLRSADHLVRDDGGQLERLYAPAGKVRAVAFSGASLTSAVRRAVRYTPIFERHVLVPPLGVRGADDLAVALEWGVGVVAVDGSDLRLVVPAAEPVLGVPSVYRWWIAELAYQAFLYESAQLESCALGSEGPCIPASP